LGGKKGGHELPELPQVLTGKTWLRGKAEKEMASTPFYFVLFCFILFFVLFYFIFSRRGLVEAVRDLK
jgi:predicted RND superfamily exporter protein